MCHCSKEVQSLTPVFTGPHAHACKVFLEFTPAIVSPSKSQDALHASAIVEHEKYKKLQSSINAKRVKDIKELERQVAALTLDVTAATAESQRLTAELVAAKDATPAA